MGVVIGVTGGIAAGKSTVARMFAGLGADSVDADAIARETLSAGSEAEAEVNAAFGPAIIDADGNIDRGKLADIVFSDDSAREKLNSITHPRIIRALEDRIKAFRASAGPREVLIAEIPLLVEANLVGMVDKVIVVVAEQRAQQSRLQMRSALSEEQVERRIRSQMPACQKAEHADWLIDTNGALQDTACQVKRIWDQLQERCNAL
jgi:dephospho-CoA kinase